MSLDINEKLSYTEYVVTEPTTDFAFGFEFQEGVDAVHVLINDVDALEAGYALRLKNDFTMEVLPAVVSGTVRIYRETDIDQSLYNYTSGALFEASTIDANFKQVLHSQQEVRDLFVKLRTDTFTTLKDFQQENLNELKDYVDGVFGMTNPNLFDGISDNMVITATGDSQRVLNTSVNARVTKLEEDTGTLAIQKANKADVDIQLATKGSAADVVALQTNKADITYVDTKVAAVAGGFTAAVATKADLATIPSPTEGKVAKVMQDPVAANNGDYYYHSGAWVIGYSDVAEAAKYTDNAISKVEVSKTFTPNLFTSAQVKFDTLPTITGTGTVITVNAIKKLRVQSAAATVTATKATAAWDFPVSLFTSGTISASLLAENVNAGSNGLAGIQYLNGSGAILGSKYAATSIAGASTSTLYTVTDTAAIPAGTTTVRVILDLLITLGVREFTVSQPFISIGGSTVYTNPVSDVSARVATVEADVAGLKTVNTAVFDKIISKNTYDTSTAQDGVLLSYATGAPVVFPTGANLGKQAVVAGATYTYSLPSSGAFTLQANMYTYDANGTFIGLEHTVPSAGELVNTVDAPVCTYKDANKTVTFTVPVGSRVRYIAYMVVYNTHTTAQFDFVVANSQLELGSSKTDFAPPAIGGFAYKLKSTALPDLTAIQNSTGRITVVRDDSYFYIRTKLSAVLDMVHQVRHTDPDVWKNNIINSYSVRTIPSNTADVNTVTAFSTGTILVSSGDDSTPVHYNGTYIGANHGAFIVHKVVANGHGKTFADVGSTYSNAGVNFTLVRIVDANTLWLVSDNTATSGPWVHKTALIAGTLTHQTGGSVSNIVISSDTLDQLTCALNNQIKTCLLNGKDAIISNGVYKCDSLLMENSYNIMNPTAICTYLKGRVGTATEQPLAVNTIATDMRVQVRYEYAFNGSWNVLTNLLALNDVNWGFAGTTQAAVLTFTGGTLHQYISKVKPMVVGGVNIDVANVADISGALTAGIVLTSGNWVDPADAPDKFVQIVKKSGANNFGQVLGYSRDRGITVQSKRNTTAEAGFVHTSKKMYPKASTGSQFAGGILPKGTSLSVSAYRSVFDYTAVPSATVYTWYIDNGAVYVVYDTHLAVSLQTLPLPRDFGGKNITVVEKTNSVTVHDDIVGTDGVVVSSTGYGYVTLKLT